MASVNFDGFNGKLLPPVDVAVEDVSSGDMELLICGSEGITNVGSSLEV